MSVVRTALIVSLLPLFAGCQLLGTQAATPKVSTVGMTRMQGNLSGEGGKLLFQPCHEERRYVVLDRGNTGVLQESASLADAQGKVFADLRGNFNASKAQGGDGQLDLHQLYRVERSGKACEDPNFRRLTLHADGPDPLWNVNVSGKGMIIEIQDQPPVALPYLEEQLPDGRFNLSSEADGQRVELWVAPQRCVDTKTGAVSHLTSELRINGQAVRGCGYYGGSRND